jgi:hypothetical protein
VNPGQLYRAAIVMMDNPPADPFLPPLPTTLPRRQRIWLILMCRFPVADCPVNRLRQFQVAFRPVDRYRECQEGLVQKRTGGLAATVRCAPCSSCQDYFLKEKLNINMNRGQ